MLTKRQHELLAFLANYQGKNQISPSYDEMRQALNLRSKSAVHALVEGLEKRGYCRRLPHCARSIEILKQPDGPSQDSTIFPSSEFEEKVPFFGVIPSSASIDILQQSVDTLSIPKDWTRDPRDLLSLKVQGDFLRDFGVLNGDLLIFQKTSEGTKGKLVLLSHQQELMVRQWEEEGSRISLKTGNKYMIPQSYPRERIQIHGEVIGVLRKI